MRKGCINLETIVFAVGIAAIVVGLMLERYTIGGLVAIASFVTYFSLVENGSWVTLFLFSFGFLLIMMEIFVPDYGVMGTIGAGLIIWGTAMMNLSIGEAVLDITVGLLLGLATFLVLFKMGYRIPFSSKWILENKLNAERGFNSSMQRHAEYLDKTAKTLTPLRPTGKAKFADGQVLEVVSDFEIIDAGEIVKVIKVTGNIIIVRREN